MTRRTHRLAALLLVLGVAAWAAPTPPSPTAKKAAKKKKTATPQGDEKKASTPPAGTDAAQPSPPPPPPAAAAAATVSAAPTAAEPGTPAAALEQALKAMANLEDERAEAILKTLTQTQKVGPEAAKAWVYLGLIHLDRLDLTQARSDFVRALGIDPTVELPISASPKARYTFAMAEKEAHEAAEAEAAKAAERRARTPFALATAPSRVPVWISGGVALGALGVGVTFGVLYQQAALQAKNAAEVGTWNQARLLASQRAVVADILFGTAAAAAITGTILFFVGRPRSAPVTLGFSPLAGGAYASIHWEF